MRTKDLRAARAKLIEDARALITAENPDGEAFANFDRMMDEADGIQAQFERMEKADALAYDLAQLQGEKADRKGISLDEQISVVDREKRIMTQLLRGGMQAVHDDDRHYLITRKVPDVYAAAMGTTPNSGGGFVVSPEWSDTLLTAMKAQGGMRAVSTIMTTDSGASLPFVTLDDTAQAATIIAENAQISEDTELTFGQVTLGAFTYKSGIMLVSLQLLNDSAFDFDAVIRDAIAGRFVRKQNSDFTIGGGTTLPRGIITDATSGRVGTTGQTTSIIFSDIVALEHSVDPVYRKGASYMMNDQSLRVVKTLVDTQQRPLFVSGLANGAPDTLMGYPIVINQDVPVMAANAKSVLFGNFSNYYIRDVRGAQMLVLRERFADFLQVGYVAYMRSDGRLISAASPVKYYANSAT